MANAEQLAILKQGGAAWNIWRDQHPNISPDLTKANLTQAILNRVNFRGADLSGADLSGARLIEADFHRAQLSATSFHRADLTDANLHGTNLVAAGLSRANLYGVNLSTGNLTGANLAGANLTEANLTEANLKLAILSGTILSRANLVSANFEGAQAYLTTFDNVDLSQAKGLETVRHGGPSTIGIDTFYRSQGKIPEAFLRGAGVPETFITSARSLVGQAIQFYSCFISYSTKDQEFAERLYADLQAKGVRCWFAPHHIEAGKKVHEQIDQAIGRHERLLLVLSRASMESEWVKTEIAKARHREVNEQKRVLFPVRLVHLETLRNWECFDADTGKDSAREIREYFIPDFSEWKNHNSYQPVFERLLRDLNAKSGEPK